MVIKMTEQNVEEEIAIRDKRYDDLEKRYDKLLDAVKNLLDALKLSQKQNEELLGGKQK